MARKIMILCGSPRAKGNTNTVAGWFAEGAASAGAEVETINLATLKLSANGCLCCMKCQSSDRFVCVIKDAAEPIFERMPQADVLVFATPVYFFSLTAQMKLLLDRMYCMYKFKQDKPEFDCAIRNRKIVAISTAGDGKEGGLGLVEETFRIMAEFSGCKFDSLLVPNAHKDPKILAADTQIREQAIKFGKSIATA